MKLNSREVATIRAALQYWKNDLDDPSLTEGFNTYFEHEPRLDETQIDRLCEHLRTGLIQDENQIELSWCVDDVLEVRPQLTREQALDVLSRVEAKHDATLGVTWDTLEFWADTLYPFKADEDTERTHSDNGVRTTSE